MLRLALRLTLLLLCALLPGRAWAAVDAPAEIRVTGEAAEKRVKGLEAPLVYYTYRATLATPRLHLGNEPALRGKASAPLFRWKGRWWSDFGGPDGTYDMRARVWAPEIGIFLSADAFAYHDARGTLWSWPNQNPVNLSDPSGNCPTCIVGATVGFVGAGLVYAFTAPTNLSYSEFLSNAVTHMAWGAAAGAIAGTGLYGSIFVTGALGVANENQLWLFALPFLGAALEEPCPVRGGGTASAGEAPTPAAAKGPTASTPAEPVNLASPQRTQHITVGDHTGGGHMWPGAPGKSSFPEGWSSDKIMHEVSDIATDPTLQWQQQTGRPGSLYTKAGDPARFVVTGVRDGVRIKVVVEPAGEGIVTAHPVEGLP